MKKYLIIILSLLPLICWGSQRTMTVSLHYDVTDFAFTQQTEGMRISSGTHRLFFDDIDTLPALPHIIVNVLVSPGEQLDTMVVTATNLWQMLNVDIAPCELPQTTDGHYSSGFRNNVTFDSVYPSGVAFNGAVNADGYHMLTFTVSPFAYDGQSQSLELTQQFQLNLTLINNSSAHAPGHPDYQPAQGGDYLRETIAKSIFNIGALDTLYTRPSRLLPTSASSPIYEYLLITNQAYSGKFRELVNWKTKKGVRAKMLKVADIDSHYTGVSQQERIKAAIKDYYENHGTRYVLLGGDEKQVPVMMCKSTENTPSDMYYACLYEDWDPDGDNLAGEIGSTVNEYFNMVPNLTVTRVASFDYNQTVSAVDRIIDYESNPDTTGWKDDILLAGVKLYTEPRVDGVQRTDVYARGLHLYNDIISPKWNCSKTLFFDSGTDMPGDSLYDVTTRHLATEMSKGYSFVHMDTHGFDTGWALEEGSFCNDQVAMINTEFAKTIVVTTACTTNKFDMSGVCLSQKMSYRNHSGVLAYLGASRVGYVKPSFSFDSLFFCNLFEDPSHRIGDVATQSRYELSMGHMDSLTYERHIALTVNPLCDPEMPIFLSRPMEFDDVCMNVKGDSLMVRLPMAGCRVCVMSPDDLGASYYCVQECDSNLMTFHGVPTSFQVCVTHPGYIPYFKRVTTRYIQNEVVSNGTIVADKVLIGSKVTDSKPHGPVYFIGNNRLYSTLGVAIEGRTTVQQGASLFIGSN